MQYLLAGALALGIVMLALVLRERRLRRRRELMAQILDLADGFERELIECRKRLREMPALIADPSTTSAAAGNAPASAEAIVASALRDLLAHRLWLKGEGQRASLQALASARDALAAAQRALQAQLARLDEARADLDGVRDVLDAIDKAAHR